MWRSAEVPDKWRSELEKSAAEALKADRENWEQLIKEGQQHSPGWTFDPEVASAERHRRRVPVSDAMFAQRLAEHGSLIRGEKG